MEAIIFAVGYALGGIFNYLLWGIDAPETYVYNITIDNACGPEEIVRLVETHIASRLVGTYTSAN